MNDYEKQQSSADRSKQLSGSGSTNIYLSQLRLDLCDDTVKPTKRKIGHDMSCKLSEAWVCGFVWAAFFRCLPRPNRTAYEVKAYEQVKLCNTFEQMNMFIEWVGIKYKPHISAIVRVN